MTDKKSDRADLGTREIYRFELSVSYTVEDSFLVEAFPPLVKKAKSKLVLEAHKRIFTSGGDEITLFFHSVRGGEVDRWTDGLSCDAPADYFADKARYYSRVLERLHEEVKAFRLKTGDLQAMAKELIEVSDFSVQPLVGENFEFHHLPGLIRSRFATEDDGISSGRIAILIDEAKFPPEVFYFRDYFLDRLANKISLELVIAVENELGARRRNLNRLIRLWRELSAVEVFYDAEQDLKLED